MDKKYTSGLSGKIKSDCRVEFIPKENGVNQLEVNSKLELLYGDSIRELAFEVLEDLGIEHCSLMIEDFGALPFVIRARIEAAVRKANPNIKVKSLPLQENKYRFLSTPDRERVTRLYLPANQPKLMLNAGLHKADCIILDLEDSVAPDEKLDASIIARNALRTLNFYNSEKMVRINQGELGIRDLEEIIPENVNVILIPKVETPEEIQAIEKKANEISSRCGRLESLYFLPIIESALGVMNAFSIAKASEKNIALAIGLEDYTVSIGANRSFEGRESLFARSMIVNASKAAGIQALDSVFSDTSDIEGLYKSAGESKELGFDGRGCIHPNQIETVKKAFRPTEEEYKNAKRIVEAYEIAQANNLGVVSVGSKMIDPPVVERALETVRTFVEF